MTRSTIQQLWDMMVRVVMTVIWVVLLLICGVLMWDWRETWHGPDRYLLFIIPLMVLTAFSMLAVMYPRFFGWVFAIGGEVYSDSQVVRTRTNVLILFVLFWLLLSIAGVTFLLFGYGRGYLSVGLAGSIGGYLAMRCSVLLWKRPRGHKLDSLILTDSEFRVNNKTLIWGTGEVSVDRSSALFTVIDVWGQWEVYDHHTRTSSIKRDFVKLISGYCAWIPLSEIHRRLAANGFLED